MEIKRERKDNRNRPTREECIIVMRHWKCAKHLPAFYGQRSKSKTSTFIYRDDFKQNLPLEIIGLSTIMSMTVMIRSKDVLHSMGGGGSLCQVLD